MLTHIISVIIIIFLRLIDHYLRDSLIIISEAHGSISQSLIDQNDLFLHDLPFFHADLQLVADPVRTAAVIAAVSFDGAGSLEAEAFRVPGCSDIPHTPDGPLQGGLDLVDRKHIVDLFMAEQGSADPVSAAVDIDQFPGL